jgi:hypothetical protein
MGVLALGLGVMLVIAAGGMVLTNWRDWPVAAVSVVVGGLFAAGGIHFLHRGSGSASCGTPARRWRWRPGRTPSWSRSGSATPRPGCSSSTTRAGSIERTAKSLALWTLRHVCGTSRARGTLALRLTAPDLRMCL